jgi:hypothetical protein
VLQLLSKARIPVFFTHCGSRFGSRFLFSTAS